MSYLPTAIEIYGGAAAGGKDPTSAGYTTTSGSIASQDVREFTLCTLVVMLVAGLAPTSVELLLESTIDDGATWANVATRALGSGAIVCTPAYRQAVYSPISSETGVSLGGEEIHEMRIRVRAKRTGGDATTRISVYAFLGSP